jgi:hypothetical protein
VKKLLPGNPWRLKVRRRFAALNKEFEMRTEVEMNVSMIHRPRKEVELRIAVKLNF